MRFMTIVKANADTEARVLPSAALLAEMAAFHEQLARAGVLLDGAGLRASALGWRVAIVVALLAYAVVRPDSLRLSRSTLVAAPPDRVFALINDLRRFNEWNPFAQLDAQNAISHNLLTAGVGGAYQWHGQQSGAGRMQISASVPARRVTAGLDFSKPFEAHNIVDFTLRAQGDHSAAVTWAMHGAMPYLHRLMTIFFDMDKTVGKNFQAGLADLKTLAETP
jgi:uncharacterized protein YndB with AHSA1/START domain